MTSIKELFREVLVNDVPRHCVQHLRDNARRLVKRTYDDGKPGSDGLHGKCLFGILFERLPPEQRIDSKQSFRRFYGQPPSARWARPSSVMNAFDAGSLTTKMILEVVDDVLEQTKPSSSVTVEPKRYESSLPLATVG